MHKVGLLRLAVVSSALAFNASRADTVITEDFATDPAARGWKVFGDSSLFAWDSQAGDLAVTWDSSKTNSYFYLPLGTTLGVTNEFDFAFSVRLDDITVGTTPGKPFTFQVAFGLLNFATASAPGFLRGTGSDSPDLLTWDYFPDSGFGATVSSTAISEQGRWASSFNSPLPLDTGVAYRFRFTYAPALRRLTTTMMAGGTNTALQEVTLKADFDGFGLDMLAVASYSDAGQDPQYAGSVLAHGVVDDVSLIIRQPVIQQFNGGFQNGTWTVRFVGRTDYTYQLEGSVDLGSWTPVGTAVAGTGQPQTLTDPRPVSAHDFYRLKAVQQ